jgi:hypothetical protein
MRNAIVDFTLLKDRSMEKQENTKLFAFKLAQTLADKQAKAAKAAPQWKLRDGVASAGCSGEDQRADGYWGRDLGVWC